MCRLKLKRFPLLEIIDKQVHGFHAQILNCISKRLNNHFFSTLLWPIDCKATIQLVCQDKHFIEHFLHTKPEGDFILGIPILTY